jgi:PIN domain nuclease of toxin-antitoxin system
MGQGTREQLVFLDTNIVVMLFDEERSLSKKVCEELDNSSFLRVSSLVKFELQVLYEKQKKGIIMSAQDYFDKLIAKLGVQETVSTNTGELISSSLNLGWTREPMDRLITAEAKLYNAKLLTSDRNILNNYELAIW